MEDLPLVISGLGLVSSLGLDAATSCAAARAGLSRAAPLEFKVVNRDTNDFEAVVGHAIPHAVVGFEGLARLLRIAQLAFDDFYRSAEISPEDSQRCGLLILLPEPGRSLRSASNREGAEEPYDNPLLGVPTRLPDRTELFERFRQVCGFQVPSENTRFIVSGSADLCDSLSTALNNVRQGTWDRCIIAAVDSLLDPPTLQWLYDQFRLKSADNPVGLQPGEAGGVILIEPASAARLAGRRVLATVSACQTDHDEQHFYTGEPPLGHGLASVISALAQVDKGSVLEPWFVSDLNGEVHRAADWGNAIVRLRTTLPTLEVTTVTHPVATFGDAGVANALVGVAVVTHAFSRKCAPSQNAMVLSSSDYGSRTILGLKSF